MKIEVLGCYGGQLPGKQLTSFLVDDHVLVDAGGATATLELERQNAIGHILVSHSHLDHVKDIPFLADNVIGMKPHPIEVVSAPAVIQTLRQHLLNNAIWPDFTVIPTKEAPVLKWREEAPETPFKIGDLTVEFVQVNHPVPCFGMFLTKGRKTILYTADTGPTDRVWERARSYPHLKAVILEVSFPNRMAELSLISGHLSPCHLPAEAKKLGRDVPIHFYHFKPAFDDVLRKEIAELKNPQFKPLTQGQIISL